MLRILVIISASLIFSNKVFCSSVAVNDLENSDANGPAPLVQKAIEQEALFRQKSIQSIQGLLSNISTVSNDIDVEKWHETAVKAANQDLQYIQKLKADLQNPKLEETPVWSLKTTKMEEAIKGAAGLLDKYFLTLADGKLPEGYEIESTTTTILKNQTSIWGNPKGTILKTALFILARTANPKLELSNLLGPQWIDESPIAHVIHVPKQINLGRDYQGFTFAYQDQKTPNGLAFTHSGYAFGGHRYEPRYPKGKAWGPEDCSSFIAKLTGLTLKNGSPFLFSTADQCALFNYKTGGFVPEVWKSGAAVQPMMELYEPLRIKDPQRDIRPGYVYMHRTYKNEALKTTTLGVGGHTALITGLRSDGILQTIGYNRDIPNGMEGFGLEDFTVNSTLLKEVMIFSVKK